MKGINSVQGEIPAVGHLYFSLRIPTRTSDGGFQARWLS